MPYYRLKFALAHGYLPPEVDHQDRNNTNDLLSNLRAASPAQNKMNRVYAVRDLPRGVYRHGNKFQTLVSIDNRPTHLGMFDTPEEASRVVEARLRVLHGKFYREQPHAPV